jgi:hypothetical protein
MGAKAGSLVQAVPEGQLVDRKWLMEQGFTRPRIDYAVRAGNLERVIPGIYRRPGPVLKWEQAVYSLNAMGWPWHVGGRSAFELQGKAHFLPVQGVRQIELFGTKPGPSWLTDFPAPFRLRVRNKKLFDVLPADALENKFFGAWDWPIPYSTPELALLEMLGLCQGEADFYLVDPFFEGAATLRLDRVQSLLERCVQVKAKRLFLWFVRRHKHAWAENLDRTRISLGSGKREIAKPGAFDPEFRITIPWEMAHGNEKSVF